MSITDELRKWKGNIQTYLSPEVVLQLRCELNVIADRIDEQHEAACAEAYGNGVESVALPDMTAYVKLPVDADKMPIHVGDYVETLIEAFEGERGRVEYLTLTEDGWCVDGDRPSTVRHVQPDTWERIIEDALSECGWEQPKEYEIDFEDSKEQRDRFVAELVERCKRLAGE